MVGVSGIPVVILDHSGEYWNELKCMYVFLLPELCTETSDFNHSPNDLPVSKRHVLNLQINGLNEHSDCSASCITIMYNHHVSTHPIC